MNTQEQPENQEIQSAREILQALVKAGKSWRLYLPNNPIRVKFLQDLHEKFSTHLSRYGDLHLTVSQHDLLCKGQEVYHNTDQADSMAFLLYADGFQELTFHRGLGREEVEGFLKVAAKDPDFIRSDEDTATILWEKSFAHVSYVVAQDFLEMETPVIQKAPIEEDLGLLHSQENQDMTAGPAPASLSLFLPTEEEIAGIKKEIEEEGQRDLMVDAISLLFSVLETERDEGVFSDILDSLDNAFDSLVFRGNLHHAAMILEKERALAGPATGLSPALKNLVLRSLARAGDSERIRMLEVLLSREGGVEDKILPVYLRQLEKTALPSLCDLMTKLHDRKIKKVFQDAMIEIGKEGIEIFLPWLEDHRSDVVRDFLYIVKRIKDPRTLEGLRKASRHKDSDIRKEVIQALVNLEDPKGRDILLTFVDDKEVSVRILAIKGLAYCRHHSAFSRLKGIFLHEGFKEKDVDEKREILFALARIGGEEAVTSLRDVVVGVSRRWFVDEEDVEVGMAAAAALKMIGSSSALAALEEGARSGKKTIKKACQEAAEELRKVRQ